MRGKNAQLLNQEGIGQESRITGGLSGIGAGRSDYRLLPTIAEPELVRALPKSHVGQSHTLPRIASRTECRENAGAVEQRPRAEHSETGLMLDE